MNKHTQHATVRLWLLIVLISFPQISETIYSPALPDIAHLLHASNHLVQWTLSIYFIGFAVGVFFWGRLSDHIGRRYAMLSGLVLYSIGSLLCREADHITVLLAARLLQGFGASCGSVITQTIAREALSDQQRHRFYSSGGFVLAFAIAAGPLIGGYLTQWFGWRANFTLLVLMGFMLLITCIKSLPETHGTRHLGRPKVTTVIMQLAKDPYVWGCMWLVACINGILFSFYAEGPFIFIRIVHLSAGQFGWLGCLIALAALIGSIVSKKLIDRYTPIQLIRSGGVILLLGCLLLLLAVSSGDITAQHPWLARLLIMLPMMIIIFGCCGFIIPMTLSTLLVKHHAIVGTAGAIFGLSYYVLVSLLTWLMGLLHNGTVMAMPWYFAVLSMISIVVCYTLIKQEA